MDSFKRCHLAKQLAQLLGVSVFSHEFEIILTLYDEGAATAGELLSRSSASNTTYYTTLKKILASGLIYAEHEDEDKRRIRYQLQDWVHEFLTTEFRQIPGWVNTKVENPDSGDTGLARFFRSIRDKLKIKSFTVDYQILMFLYEYKSSSSGELFAMCDASRTTFYVSLKRLLFSGLVDSNQNGTDHRQKYYFLPEWVRQTLNDSHKQIGVWALERLGP